MRQLRTLVKANESKIDELGFPGPLREEVWVARQKAHPGLGLVWWEWVHI